MKVPLKIHFSSNVYLQERTNFCMITSIKVPERPNFVRHSQMSDISEMAKCYVFAFASKNITPASHKVLSLAPLGVYLDCSLVEPNVSLTSILTANCIVVDLSKKFLTQ